MTAKLDPVVVACPSCGAEAGTRCWSGTRRGRHLARGHHQDRIRVARGEHVPENFGNYLKRELRRVTQEAMATVRKDRS